MQSAVCVFIDKPAGMTSHDVVSRLRKLFPGTKMGHGGTLDPFATGVLPVFFGDWTKLSSLFTHANKRYIATLDLGRLTDTGDHTGKSIREAKVPFFKPMELSLLAKKLHGDLYLPVPIYSALKIDGVPMHELARKGQLTEPARHRKNTLYRIKIEELSATQLKIDVACSHGTYIRSLGEHIANQLKTVGHLSALRRVEYYQDHETPYPFRAVSLDSSVNEIQSAILKKEQLLTVLPEYKISASSLRNFLLGRVYVTPLRIHGWHHVTCHEKSVGVILIENGIITQRMFFLSLLQGYETSEKSTTSLKKLFDLHG